MAQTIEHGLSRDLIEVTRSSPRAESVTRIVTLCHRMATAFVRSKLASGHLNLQVIALEPPDIAYDCIADLFERNDAGEFPILKSYLESIDVASCSEPWLVAHLRRLVFSRVNDGIFRLYHDADPVLGKILRNIKLAVASLGNFEERDRFGETWLVPTACDTLEHLPPFDRDALEQRLRGEASMTDHVPAILSRLARLLREQSEHSRLVPLLTIASAMRSIYAAGSPGTQMAELTPVTLLEDELSRMVRAAVGDTKRDQFRPYVGSGKVTASEYDDYFAVLETGLLLKIAEGDGEGFSYYAELSRRRPGLTSTEYRRRHKNRIEYLGKIIHKRVAGLIRK